MSSITKFFRNLGNQIKNVLGIEKSHVAYQAYASEEQFQIACEAHDELQFRRRCMAKTASEMRQTRREGCRAKYRWNKKMVRKVAHKSYDIPSCWENGKYVNKPNLKAISRCMSLIDLRETEEDVVEKTRWTKCRKDDPRHPFLDPEEGFSTEFPILSDAPPEKAKSSVSAVVSKILPCMKAALPSVSESVSIESFHPCVLASAPGAETAETLPEQELALAEVTEEPEVEFLEWRAVPVPEEECPEMKSHPDFPHTEIKSKPHSPFPEFKWLPILSNPVWTSLHMQLESPELMQQYLQSRPKRFDVHAWAANYIDLLKQHYNEMYRSGSCQVKDI